MKVSLEIPWDDESVGYSADGLVIEFEMDDLLKAVWPPKRNRPDRAASLTEQSDEGFLQEMFREADAAIEASRAAEEENLRVQLRASTNA